MFPRQGWAPGDPQEHSCGHSLVGIRDSLVRPKRQREAAHRDHLEKLSFILSVPKIGYASDADRGSEGASRDKGERAEW